jgi:hypothetical protein
MIFRSNGENMIIMTPISTEKNKVKGIIVRGFKPKTKWLPRHKFYSFDDKTLDTGKMKCLDVALELLLE